MTRANEEWRNDPARRRAAADLHADWLTAVVEAEQHLLAAVDAFGDVPLPPHDPTASLVLRVLDAAEDGVRHARDVRRVPASETLIGNMAAFGIGWTDKDGS